MIKYILVCAMGILTFGLMAQSLSKTDADAIGTRFDQFLKHTSNQEFDKLLGFLHPKQFEGNSSVSMKEMSQMLQLLRIKFEIENVKVGELNGLNAQGNNKYALADYSMDMKLTLNEQNKAFAEQIVSGLKGQFGPSNVAYDASKYTISAKGGKHVIWVKEKTLGNDWFLVDFDPKNPNAWKNIIPEKVLTEAATKAK